MLQIDQGGGRPDHHCAGPGRLPVPHWRTRRSRWTRSSCPASRRCRASVRWCRRRRPTPGRRRAAAGGGVPAGGQRHHPGGFAVAGQAVTRFVQEGGAAGPSLTIPTGPRRWCRSRPGPATGQPADDTGHRQRPDPAAAACARTRRGARHRGPPARRHQPGAMWSARLPDAMPEVPTPVAAPGPPRDRLPPHCPRPARHPHPRRFRRPPPRSTRAARRPRTSCTPRSATAA